MSDAQSFTIDSTEGISLLINILSMIKLNLSNLVEMFRLSHFNKLYEISKFQYLKSAFNKYTM